MSRLVNSDTCPRPTQGHVVIPGALSACELARLRKAFDSDRRDSPDCWELRGKVGALSPQSPPTHPPTHPREQSAS